MVNITEYHMSPASTKENGEQVKTETWFWGKQWHLVSNEARAQTLGPCALAPSAGRCCDLYICLGCRNFLAFVFDYLMSLKFSSNAVFYSVCVKSCFILVFKKKLLQTSRIGDMRRITKIFTNAIRRFPVFGVSSKQTRRLSSSSAALLCGA